MANGKKPVPAPRSGSAARGFIDVGLAVGLVVALVVVAATEPRGSAYLPPPPVVLSAEEASGAFAIPPVPDLPFSLADLLGDKTPPPIPPPPPPPADDPPSPPPPPEEPKIDPTKRLGLGFDARQRAFGVRSIADTGRGRENRLTFNEFGETNHTAVSVDGEVLPFLDPKRGRLVADLTSVGKVAATASDKVLGGREEEANKLPEQGPYVVKWQYGQVLFEQWLDFEPGEVSRRMDTVRVRYTLKNLDQKRTHAAGVRVMIDTFIGSNDGVPFFIPGRDGVVDRPLQLQGQEVPDYILALERNDLSDPAITVVQLGLRGKAGEEIEKPEELAFHQWPGKDGKLQPWLATYWTWRLARTFEKDSAVVLVYPEKKLEPGQARIFSFTYGLGSLSSQASRNPELSLSWQGPVTAGKPFLLTAFVKNPKSGQTVTLTLPKSLRLADTDSPEKPVDARPGAAVTKIDWTVTPAADSGGKYAVAATLSGAAKPETGTVYVQNPNPVLHGVTVTGAPAPGGLIRVTAAVLNAAPGTTATIVLPTGLTLDPGEKADQPVSPGPVAQPTWLVRVAADQVGTVEVRVRLANPTAEARAAVDIKAGPPAVAAVRLDGLPQAGGVLRVTAQVVNPVPGTTAAIELPAGLSLSPGEKPSQPVPAGRVAQVTWLARVAPDRMGPAAVTVRLTPAGDPVTKSVTLSPPAPVLTVRVADESPATPGRPIWVIARVFAWAPAGQARLALPEGWTLAGGHAADKSWIAKSADGVPFAEVAWPVVLAAYSGPTAELTVSVPGVGERGLKVRCDRGSVIR